MATFSEAIDLVIPAFTPLILETSQAGRSETQQDIAEMGMELLSIYIDPVAAERILEDDPEMAKRLYTVSFLMAKMLDASQSPLQARSYRAIANYLDEQYDCQ